MSSSRELVQFKVVTYVPGDIIIREKDEEFFDPPLLVGLPNDKEIADVLEHVPWAGEGDLRPPGEQYRITVPLIWVQPTGYMGDVADATGVGYDVEMVGVNDVFDEYLADIAQLAEKYGYQYHDHTIGYEGHKTVAVITVWRYDTWQSYDGEFESSTELLGAVDLRQLDVLE